jgi:cytochrome o ubiquinol oxidase subunit 2
MIRSIGLRLAPLPLLCGLAGCDAITHGAMNAAGPIARGERQVYLELAVVLIFVAGPVLLLTPLMAWHYRLSNRNKAWRTTWNFYWWLEALIWLPPAGIVIGLSVLVWDATHRLDPYRAIAAAQPPIEVQAVALDWKWLFIYPGEHIATLNQLAIPAGRPVRISLTSGTVMQSLLIPRLAGQIYAMPGMRTQLNLAADLPGQYLGANVQYNGPGFARQQFVVTAMAPADYRRWVTGVRAGNHPLDQTAIARLSEPSTLPQPIAFSNVPDGVFRQFLAHHSTHAMEMRP